MYRYIFSSFKISKFQTIGITVHSRAPTLFTALSADKLKMSRLKPGETFDTGIVVVSERRRKRLDKSTTKISMTFREEKKEREKKVETAVWNLIQKLHSPLNKHRPHVGKAFKRPVIL